MKSVGFPISHKENEKRRALLPDEVKLISHPEYLFFETGYGNVLGFSDNDYRMAGGNVCSREEVLKKDVVCDPKIGDADYLGNLKQQIVFGWIHAVQNKDITEKLVENHLTGIAWEDMFDSGRHVFWRNNELAGEAAVIHAIQCFGKLPYETKAAVIGRGNTARGAIKILNMLGSEVVQYERRTERLLRSEIHQYDIIVNCVLWDVNRHDHIIRREDLQRMKRDSMIIDVSCDRHGGVETSVPTTIANPVYFEEGVLHYCVDHTPSLFYKTFSYNNSKVIWSYIQDIVLEQENTILKDAIIIEDGNIIDSRINKFQNRN